MNLQTILALTMTLILSNICSAGPLTAEQKLADFTFLTAAIQAGYGPLEYKGEHKIVDIPALNARFTSEIPMTQSNEAFYNKLLEYVASYKDGHFVMYTPSTLVAQVPINTEIVNGQVLITSIDRNQLSEEAFPFAVGDVVLSVDDQPIEKFLDENVKYISSGNEFSRRQSASGRVFWRRAARHPFPTAKTVKVEIRPWDSRTPQTVELPWKVTGEDPEVNLFSSPSVWNKSKFSLLNRQWIEDSKHVDNSYQCSGTTRIKIPDGATKIMDEPFVAYYYPTAKGNVGYLRIPHYYPQPIEDLQTILNWEAQYRYAVQILEANTVGLIIDQDHNCGGSVDIVNFTISLFMDRAFQASQFQFLANKETYIDFKTEVDAMPKNTEDYVSGQFLVELVKKTWLEGKTRLTEKTGFGGSLVEPSFVHYTKPVVVLIDERSGSGGDMFPAMMQGLGRAKLFGQTTGGLGGHVSAFASPLPFSQLKFNMTKSLFYDPRGVAIENHGAVPDQTYDITREDILTGFQPYQQAYTSYLLDQIQ
jgi:C-terminal processing protease CtpA/Prc